MGESLSLPPLRALLTEVGARIEVVVADARQQMDALLDAVLAVSSGLELDATLRQIVQAAIDLVGARYGAMGVVGDDGTLSRFVQVGIDPQTERRIGRPPRGLGLLGVVLEDEKPLRLADLTEHRDSCGFPPNHPPMRSFLGVQVRARGEVFGRLYLTEKVAGTEFTEHDEVVVQALAGAAGVAIDNARLYEMTRRRQRWLEASSEVGAVLLGGTDADEALQLIADRALELAGARTPWRRPARGCGYGRRAGRPHLTARNGGGGLRGPIADRPARARWRVDDRPRVRRTGAAECAATGVLFVVGVRSGASSAARRSRRHPGRAAGDPDRRRTRVRR